ncbi:MAG: efflux RND transporter periplasmic adaptor subunit [Planctomycetes bacterium]|nr:efflux RND transporter periplasmic adaptor subunit [Planctomycetota bacterium]
MKKTLVALSLILAGFSGGISCTRDSTESSSDAEPEAVSLTLFTSKIELFMEYQPLIRGEARKFVSHFTVLATGEPVRSGTLKFEGVYENGQTVSFRSEGPARDGLFTPVHTFDRPGKIKARFLVDSPQITESIDLGVFVVYASRSDALAATSAVSEPEPTGAIPFLMEQQWKIGMLLATVGERSLVERLHCSGDIVTAIDRSADVRTPIAGRLLAPRGRPLPRLGDTVKAGDLLAVIEPTTPSLNETATYAMDLRTKAVSIQRDIDDALAQINFARREHARLTGLHSQGVSSARELYEVERDLALAESQHNAAMAMKAKYDEAADELDVFLEAARKPNPDRPRHDPLRIQLSSPISGVVVAAAHVEDEQLNGNDRLFGIVDLNRVWVATHVSEFDLSKLPKNRNAQVVPAAFPDRRIDVLSAGGKEIHLGSIVESATRTATLYFEIPNPNNDLRAGLLVDVYLETTRIEKAIAVPESAIVHDNGIPIAFVLLEGERCQQRELELGIRDSGFVEVRRGLAVGERIVARGAQAVKISSKSGAAFGHGHVH